MNSPESAQLPAFETLPVPAQERIGALATRFAITNQQAVVATILIGQGVPLMKLLASCRASGVPLSMADLEAIQSTVDSWISLEDQRKAIVERLEQKGLLTEERRARIESATTKQEVMAVYYEAVPLQLAEGKGGSTGPFDPSWRPYLLFDLLTTPVFVVEVVGGVTQIVIGAGNLISEAWDKVDITSLWD